MNKSRASAVKSRKKNRFWKEFERGRRSYLARNETERCRRRKRKYSEEIQKKENEIRQGEWHELL